MDSGKRCAGPTVGASYQLEYGEDRIEMHTGAIQKGQRVLLIDDLIATGGTLAAGIKLIEEVANFAAFATLLPCCIEHNIALFSLSSAWEEQASSLLNICAPVVCAASECLRKGTYQPAAYMLLSANNILALHARLKGE